MTPPGRRPGERLVRSYVVTGGRSQPSCDTLDLVTLLIAADGPPPTAPDPEKRRLMELCRPGALSLAEVAGHLELPVSVTRVLVADLMDSGHLVTRAPVPSAGPPSDARFLREVLDGLRSRL
ncbi:DUF742 domain-containing protein [Streptomyces populi]|uniref:DUF742 domain-containing protein n=1 Tax=Streptomyces populi TaxID=2058924 RepID=UPI00142E27FC|nr:DUF742 domain-containing protein [Streptomyces populi]